MKTEEATIAPHFGFHILVVEEIFVLYADKDIVEKVYWNNRWYKGNGYTVKELTDRFINWAETLSLER